MQDTLACFTLGGPRSADMRNSGSKQLDIEIRYDKTLSLARSTSALLLQPGLDILHNHDNIMISNSYLLIFLSMTL